jgi:hypothetical protein
MPELTIYCDEQELYCDNVDYYCDGSVVTTDVTYTSTTHEDVEY